MSSLFRLPSQDPHGNDTRVWLTEHGFTIGQYNPHVLAYAVTLPNGWSASGIVLSKTGGSCVLYDATGVQMGEIVGRTLHLREHGFAPHTSWEDDPARLATVTTRSFTPKKKDKKS